MKKNIKKIYTGLIIGLLLISSVVIVKNEGIAGLINIISGNKNPISNEQIISENGIIITEEGKYDTKDEVAIYIYYFEHLPSNYVTKSEAKNHGWTAGPLDKVIPGYSIGGDKFGNNEGVLPSEDKRIYYECDIDTVGKSSRGQKRIVFSNDGLIYYTEDHYTSFELLYGEE